MDLKDEGFVKLPRNLMYERVFQNEGLWKIFTWGLMKASYKERWVSLTIGKGTTEVHLMPGQFIYGRNSAAIELTMHPSTVRKRMNKLKKAGFCTIQSTTHYSIITIVNYDTYQGVPKKGAIQSANQGPTKDHKQQSKQSKDDISSTLFSLKGRYSDQDLIERGFKAIASTRKSGKVADSVLLAQLRKWDKYPVDQVEAGLKTYLEKDLASEGKREPYLLAIIKNNNGQSSRQQTASEPHYFRKLN